LMAELQGSLEKDPGLHLDVSWKLYREKGGQ
jgi:hypothetical protein